MDRHETGPTQENPANATIEELLDEITGLRAALKSRDIIGQGKGIIRLLTHSDAQRAFNLLSRMSQDTNRPVREVAEQIAESAGSGRPLPADLITSWQRHTADAERGGPDQELTADVVSAVQARASRYDWASTAGGTGRSGAGSSPAS